ncbi:hypothetical protein DL93DRAFT_2195711 [Clavulina sp. PMI_390]|nr:hypothetical protein DL93DRAFT_2195711 [Clavulina sp. PMI_390]
MVWALAAKNGLHALVSVHPCLDMSWARGGGRGEWGELETKEKTPENALERQIDAPWVVKIDGGVKGSGVGEIGWVGGGVVYSFKAIGGWWGASIVVDEKQAQQRRNARGHRLRRCGGIGEGVGWGCGGGRGSKCVTRSFEVVVGVVCWVLLWSMKNEHSEAETPGGVARITVVVWEVALGGVVLVGLVARSLGTCSRRLGESCMLGVGVVNKNDAARPEGAAQVTGVVWGMVLSEICASIRVEGAQAVRM